MSAPSTAPSTVRQPRRPAPSAAAALFALGGIVILLVPELASQTLTGEPPELLDLVGDIVFTLLGAAAAYALASRIESAFRAETAARETVERREHVLADVIDAMPAAVLLLAEADKAMVAHANPTARRLLDLDSSEAMPQPLQHVLPIDPATAEAIIRALDSRSPWTGERTLATTSGRRLPLTIGVTPLGAGSGVRGVVVATDRTELRYAERESERLAVELEGFVQTAPVGFITVGPDGIVAAWNAAAERTLGWTAAEIVGSRLPPELGAAIAASLASGATIPSAPRGAQAVPAEGREVHLHRSTGEPVAIRLTATTAYGRGNDFFGFTAMFEDVTEARRIEAERDEAEARFRAAVDASPVPLILIDPEGKVRLWSAAAEGLFGWTASEAMGRLFPPVPDEGLPQFFARLARVMDGEMASGELLHYVDRAGSPIPVRVWSAPVRASDGTLVGVMGAFRAEPEPAAG